MTATTLWTKATVRAELPDVTVEIGGERLPARVIGRKERYATIVVTIPYGTGVQISFEVAWDTIVSTLNRNRPILY